VTWGGERLERGEREKIVSNHTFVARGGNFEESSGGFGNVHRGTVIKTRNQDRKGWRWDMEKTHQLQNLGELCTGKGGGANNNVKTLRGKDESRLNRIEKLRHLKGGVGEGWEDIKMGKKCTAKKTTLFSLNCCGANRKGGLC